MRVHAEIKRIIVVDDEKEYTSALAKKLKKEGYKVDCFSDPVKAISMAIKKPYDLVISEYKFENMDGFQLVGILQGIMPTLHSILLTKCLDEAVELRAIESGIDQFINKQKSIEVAVKYIVEILNREYQQVFTPRELISQEEGIVLNTRKREVYKDDQIIDVTKKEYDLLLLFLSNKGVALSREAIAEQLWTTEIEEIDLRVIDGHINRLRAKLNLFCINAIRGYGYKWNEQ
ncbi:two-component system alkaline phosphatase synthesis response regulator PhoP/two-component system response regulator CssR [Breznakia blatticola]|uniref:Two-component system alkaline phosphatase synthesis response regulator PhoP/two-component system response regulator CssR n=1 Tax=Breznakia blatticola TaxID=1754012 RepID=A0A4R7ZIK7_9FIRM|nr:response regulator transcription factor [Breznakia blatticola]TDW16271.1 two-component system alkaline phosphatase synthesis response regulator PhoP/two-component system response regulator CssR [Breznakia blatticola]